MPSAAKKRKAAKKKREKEAVINSATNSPPRGTFYFFLALMNVMMVLNFMNTYTSGKYIIMHSPISIIGCCVSRSLYLFLFGVFGVSVYCYISFCFAMHYELFVFSLCIYLWIEWFIVFKKIGVLGIWLFVNTAFSPPSPLWYWS